MPRSTPTTAWFSRLGGVCSISTVRLTNQRSAVRDTTADLILPTKRTDSRIFTQPITGSLTRLSYLDRVGVIFVRTVISPETVVFSLLFELRMVESPLTLRLLEVSEVILERGPEVLDRLLRRVLGDLPHPCERVVLEAIELAAQR